MYWYDNTQSKQTTRIELKSISKKVNVLTISGSSNSTQKNKKQGMTTKVYLVFQRVNIATNSQAHERLIAAKLTKAAADKVADSTVGCYVHKIIATK